MKEMLQWLLITVLPTIKPKILKWKFNCICSAFTSKSFLKKENACKGYDKSIEQERKTRNFGTGCN